MSIYIVVAGGRRFARCVRGSVARLLLESRNSRPVLQRRLWELEVHKVYSTLIIIHCSTIFRQVQLLCGFPICVRSDGREKHNALFHVRLAGNNRNMGVRINSSYRQLLKWKFGRPTCTYLLSTCRPSILTGDGNSASRRTQVVSIHEPSCLPSIMVI